jgi:hypothetical protein
MLPAASLYLELRGGQSVAVLGRELNSLEVLTSRVYVPGTGSVDFHALAVAARWALSPAVILHVAQACRLHGVAPELEQVLEELQQSRMRPREVVQVLKALHSLFGLPVGCRRCSAGGLHAALVCTVVQEIHVVQALPALQTLEVACMLEAVTEFLLLGPEALQQQRVEARRLAVPLFPRPLFPVPPLLPLLAPLPPPLMPWP